MKKELPGKLSELLRLAVKDAKKLSKNPKYVLRMLDWHYPKGDKCHVCMAGAVMACELKTDKVQPKMPCYFDPDTEYKLMAINAMREGNFIEAHNNLNGDINNSHFFNNLPDNQFQACEEAERVVRKTYNDNDAYYNKKPTSDRAHWVSYLTAAKILEKAGL